MDQSLEISLSFLKEYYTRYSSNPSELGVMYSKDSTCLMGQGCDDADVFQGAEAIRRNLATLPGTKFQLAAVDATQSVNNSILITVEGTLLTAESSQDFHQTFVLAPNQRRGYYIHNEITRIKNKEVFDDVVREVEYTRPLEEPELPQEVADVIKMASESPEPQVQAQTVTPPKDTLPGALINNAIVSSVLPPPSPPTNDLAVAPPTSAWEETRHEEQPQPPSPPAEVSPTPPPPETWGEEKGDEKVEDEAVPEPEVAQEEVPPPRPTSYLEAIKMAKTPSASVRAPVVVKGGKWKVDVEIDVDRAKTTNTVARLLNQAGLNVGSQRPSRKGDRGAAGGSGNKGERANGHGKGSRPPRDGPKDKDGKDKEAKDKEAKDGKPPHKKHEGGKGGKGGKRGKGDRYRPEGERRSKTVVERAN